jgi:signal transduction histidine kinase/CheY-like chemotaxis protein
VIEFLRKLFMSDFMPHGHCYYWDPAVLWLNVISDGLIALSYYAIPFLLFRFIRRRKDLSFQWIFVAFAVFILACGTTHLMAVWTIWTATYRLDGVIKAITALASVLTAILLVPLTPKLIALPSPAQLEAINAGLEKEIGERKNAEAQVRCMNAELEHRVAERTAELLTANEQLSNANQELRSEIARREALEGQLLHAQKMEAVGRLAGGVAHDFNNILTVILGWSDMILAKQNKDTAVGRSAEEIRNAANRAAALTRQLLAFSRKQILQPRALDLNATIGELGGMLSRLLGDDIKLVSSLQPGIGMVKADPSQIHQVIMNLVVNARDAMPDGGTLVIETGTMRVDEEYCFEHVDFTPGVYVVLAITDSGQGMDEATKARIFEPFFTTKDPGKGTGLGLSTVFGIVKQSGGHILVYSEVGHGTAFKILLPQVETVAEPETQTERMPSSGTETILLCEDDEQVRALVRSTLTANGYTVLEASSMPEAVLLTTRHTGRIHLLLTDVVLQQGNGGELATALQAALPEIKVLFMSGFTESGILTRGVLDPGVRFLQKPFTPQDLCRKIREVLDT